MRTVANRSWRNLFGALRDCRSRRTRSRKHNPRDDGVAHDTVTFTNVGLSGLSPWYLTADEGEEKSCCDPLTQVRAMGPATSGRQESRAKDRRDPPICARGGGAVSRLGRCRGRGRNGNQGAVRGLAGGPHLSYGTFGGQRKLKPNVGNDACTFSETLSRQSAGPSAPNRVLCANSKLPWSVRRPSRHLRPFQDPEPLCLPPIDDPLCYRGRCSRQLSTSRLQTECERLID